MNGLLNKRRVVIILSALALLLIFNWWWHWSHGLRIIHKPESYRQFVGDNPDSCTQYINSVLISYPCLGLFTEANIHLPATASLPSYTIKRSVATNNGYIQDFAYSKGQHVVLLRHPPLGEDPPYYSISSIRSNLSARSGVLLKDLDASKAYFVKPYNGGLIIYDAGLSQAFYNELADPRPEDFLSQDFNYPELSPSLQKITLPSPSDKEFAPVFLEVSGRDIFSTLYVSSNKKASEVIVNSSGKTKSLKFKEIISKALLCGEDRLCLISQKGMKAYDISGDKPRYLFTIGNVMDMMRSGQDLLVVNKKGVLNLNTKTRKGFYEYTFGDYSFSSIQTAPGGYVLSLTNNKQKKVALYINQADSDKHAIDKKIAVLQKLPEIKTISANKQYIYISPDLGTLRRVDSTSEYGYDQKVREANLAKINREIDKLRIDRKEYSIIFTL